jgi:hypothetical protein
MQLKINHRILTPPYWRFPNFLLEDDIFVKNMKIILSAMTSEAMSNVNYSAEWEKVKRAIKDYTMLYQKSLRNKCAHKVNNRYKLQAEKIMATMGWDSLIDNDAPSSNHIARWAAWCRPKPLCELRIQGRTISEPSELCKIIRKYFADQHDTNTQLAPTPHDMLSTLTPLSDVDQEFLNTDLNRDDFTAALKSLSKRKAPGLDGLTVEFYLAFWHLLVPIFTLMAQHSFANGRLPRTTATSIISLMKKAGDPLEIKNWRPLSISNVDYKIITKALASRLSSVINCIITPEQSYCVPGRSIFDTISLIRDVIWWCNEGHHPLAILSLDQAKAFDRVNHRYLFDIMERMSLGSKYIGCIKTIYNNALCMIRVQNMLTAPFFFRKGIRQGCPLSGMLYAISLEPFLRIAINSLSGLTIPGAPQRNVVLAAYADDVSIFITNENDFNLVIPTFQNYAKFSGAELNTVKSKGLWVGAWKNRLEKPLSFDWNSHGMKFLGVWLSNDPQE